MYGVIGDSHSKLHLSITDFSLQDIAVLSELGRNNGGTICKVQHRPSGLLMARKTYEHECKKSLQIVQDLQILTECSSQFIVEVLRVCQVENAISVYMEYVDAGGLDSLLCLVGRCPEPIIVLIATEVVQGLLFLKQELHIAHRNLKPSNILLSRSGQVKLCDFVVSLHLMETLAASFVGIYTYMAPERLIGEPFTSASDVWSLGMSLAEIAIGRYPIPNVDPVDYLCSFAPDLESNSVEHWRAAMHGEPLPALDSFGEKNCNGLFDLFAHVVEQPPPRLPAFCFTANFLQLLHCCLQKDAQHRLSVELLHWRLLPDLLGQSAPDCLAAGSVRVTIRAYLRGIFARQQAEALDAVASAVNETAVHSDLEENEELQQHR